MSFEWALRLTEVLLGFAVLLQSLEHLSLRADSKGIFAFRAICSLILISGFATPFAAPFLFVSGIWLIKKYQGPFNGGSDRMTLLALLCLSVASLAPQTNLRELALGYLGIQLLLSYFVAGIVKLRNPEWLNGIALQKIFCESRYPTSRSIRSWGKHRPLMLIGGIVILLFEILFPMFMLTAQSLWAGLAIAFLFHLLNAWLLGLNRFVWAWLAAFPALIWLQERI